MKHNTIVYLLKLHLQDNEPGTSQGQINRVSVEELLEQLQITQTELEKVRVSTTVPSMTATNNTKICSITIISNQKTLILSIHSNCLFFHSERWHAHYPILESFSNSNIFKYN